MTNPYLTSPVVVSLILLILLELYSKFLLEYVFIWKLV